MQIVSRREQYTMRISRQRKREIYFLVLGPSSVVANGAFVPRSLQLETFHQL